MSETHEPAPEEGTARPKPMLVTNYPTAPDVLVITAPQNVPMSFLQLLAMSGLTQEGAASLQSQIDALTARVAALESA